MARPNRLRILLTIHHDLDENAGAPGATIRLAAALRRLGHGVEILSHDDLPKSLRGRATLFCFPMLVACARLRGEARVL